MLQSTESGVADSIRFTKGAALMYRYIPIWQQRVYNTAISFHMLQKTLFAVSSAIQP